QGQSSRLPLQLRQLAAAPNRVLLRCSAPAPRANSPVSHRQRALITPRAERLRAHENPAQGMGIRAPTERGSEIPRGDLGVGEVRGTPEGVYSGMPFIGTLQARAAF